MERSRHGPGAAGSGGGTHAVVFDGPRRRKRRGALAVFIPWRVGAEESGAANYGFGGAMLLDLRGPPGRCSGCWPHDGAVAGGAVANSYLVIIRFGAVAMVTARPTGSASPRPDRNSWLAALSSMSSSLSRFSGWRSRSLSLGEGLPDSTGARDGTRADAVLDRGRRRLFSF